MAKWTLAKWDSGEMDIGKWEMAKWDSPIHNNSIIQNNNDLKTD